MAKKKTKRQVNNSGIIRSVYLSVLFASLHFGFVAYINSSFLSLTFPDRIVGLLFTLASIIQVLIFLSFGDLLRRYGIFKIAVGFVLLEIASIIGMISVTQGQYLAPIFILHLTSITMIFFTFDIFLESSSKTSATGSIRATFNTIISISFIATVFLVGQLLVDDNYARIYLISSVLLIPLLIVILTRLKEVKDSKYVDIDFIPKTKELIANKNMYGAYMGQFLLRFFYATMVIYMPIYLNSKLGFSWPEIGVMFTIMLIPFVIFEWPIGKIADAKTGEKEFLIAGFIILAFSCAIIPFISAPTFLKMTIALFMTRVGASFVEISNESYFYKHVTSRDAEMIGLYRMNRPIAYIGAPLVASATLLFLPFQFIFLVLGIIMTTGIYFTSLVKDTK